jgi:AraC family transcriptional regulator
MTDSFASATGIMVRAPDGALVPGIPTLPHYSSSALSWQGFLLERHSMPPTSVSTATSPNHILGIPLTLTPPQSITWRIEGKTLRGNAVPNRVYMRAAEEDYACTSTAPGDGLFLSVAPSAIAWACDLLKIKGSHMLHSRFAGQEEQPDLGTAGLIRKLDQCARGETPNGSLYEETLLLELSLKLVMLYRADGHSLAPPSRMGALPRRKRDAVQDFIFHNLSEPITLDDIAKTVHLSTYHLCRQFRKTMSMSLWQYVSKCRVAYAHRLIQRHPDMPLIGVAAASGFESYSAFFNAFRQVHRASPSAMRNKREPEISSAKTIDWR